MSSCIIVQGKGFCVVGTDTAVSDEINGKNVRIGYTDKIFKINDETYFFGSGKTDDVKQLLQYIRGLVNLDIYDISNYMRNIYDERIGVVLININRIVAISHDDNFKPTIYNAPTISDDLVIKAFAMKNYELQKYMLNYVNKQNKLNDIVLHNGIVSALNSVVCAGIGGMSNIVTILSDKVSRYKYQLKDNTPLCYLNSKNNFLSIGNGNFLVDNSGHCTARSIHLTGGYFESGSINGTTIEGAYINGGSINIDTDATLGNNLYLGTGKNSSIQFGTADAKISSNLDGITIDGRQLVVKNDLFGLGNIYMGPDNSLVATQKWVLEQGGGTAKFG